MIPDMKDLRAETDFVTAVLEHPAGFHLGVFGILEVRSCSESGASHDDRVTYEVSWDDVDSGGKTTIRHSSFATAREAAVFFVEKRAADQIGVDYETELMLAEVQPPQV